MLPQRIAANNAVMMPMSCISWSLGGNFRAI